MSQFKKKNPESVGGKELWPSKIVVADRSYFRHIIGKLGEDPWQKLIGIANDPGDGETAKKEVLDLLRSSTKGTDEGRLSSLHIKDMCNAIHSVKREKELQQTSSVLAETPRHRHTAVVQKQSKGKAHRYDTRSRVRALQVGGKRRKRRNTSTQAV
ncbi:hypothetical protein FLAG1_07716 [Fusarium langsethiae]|uniref:Uncharacterized protein n=1 Tax=Fusarium langsethiae TaxID=179993 RepID=A0A0M9ET83_FUSLA|nr:hypothetical protein FLAG1_07716 [Fusarium langsethiae]